MDQILGDAPSERVQGGCSPGIVGELSMMMAGIQTVCILHKWMGEKAIRWMIDAQATSKSKKAQAIIHLRFSALYLAIFGSRGTGSLLRAAGPSSVQVSKIFYFYFLNSGFYTI